MIAGHTRRAFETSIFGRNLSTVSALCPNTLGCDSAVSLHRRGPVEDSVQSPDHGGRGARSYTGGDRARPACGRWCIHRAMPAMARRRAGLSCGASDAFLHGGLGARGLADRYRAGRRGDHALVHFRLHCQRGRAARRASRSLSTSGRTRSTSMNGDRGRNHPAHPGDSAGALRRRRRRDGCDQRDCGAARVNGWWKMPRRRSLRATGAAARRLGNLGSFSFHETKNMMSGEGGALVNNPEAFVARRDHPRERHQPKPLLPRAGGQIHLGGSRVFVSTRRDRCFLPVRPAREKFRNQRRSARHLAGL